MSGLLKKALSMGVGAALLTEDGIKALSKDLKLPKEMIPKLLESAQGFQSELFKSIIKETLDRFPSKLSPVELISEILRRNEFDIQLKVKVTPRETQK